ncbi:MAG: transglutaminase TgpA family protein [Planctomycetota bacterium]
MRLLGTFPILAYAVVLLSIVGVGVATNSAALLLVCGVLAAMSWYVSEGPRGRSLPSWTANVLIIAVSLSCLVDLAQHRDDVMGVLARFIVWLMLIKLYQHKAPRDYAQLLGLSLLVMLIGALRSTDLLFAVVLLIYAVLGLYVLLLFQLYAANERTRAARLKAIPAGYRLLPSLQPIVGRRTALHLRSLTATVAVVGLVVSSILFVLIPRDEGRGFIRAWGAAGPPRTGFAAEVDLVGGTRITESRRIALKLRLTGASGAVEPPLLLRGAVLDSYRGQGRWTASARARWQTLMTEPPGLTWLAPPADGATVTQEFELLLPQPMLFSMYVPVAVGTGESRGVRFDPLTQTIEDNGSGRLARYTVKADPAPGDETLRALAGRFGAVDGDSIVGQFRNFDKRFTERARDVLAARRLLSDPAGTPEDRWAWQAAGAEALTEHLRNNSSLTYAIDLSDVQLPAQTETGQEDPIAQFLFTTNTGHCEYFASALAALCNCAGIPARLVTGFIVSEFNETAGVYVVRESHAHAWVEVQVSPWRWQAFDPTPPGTLEPIDDGSGHSLADRWWWLFDRFEASWIDSFVTFDKQARKRVLQRLDPGWSEKLGRALDVTQQWLAAVNRAFYFGPAGYIWMGIVGLAVAIAAVAIGMRMRRTTQLRATMHLPHAHRGVYHRMLRQLGFYLDMLEALERSGSAKPSWQPPLHYAQALSARHSEGASLVRRLTEMYYAARYGSQDLSRQDISRAEDLVRQLQVAMLRPDPAGRAEDR